MTAPYRECLYTFTGKVTSPERFRGDELLIATWAFRDRTILESALLRPGDNVECKLLNYEDARDIETIHLVDELGDIEQQLYFAVNLVLPLEPFERMPFIRKDSAPEWDHLAQFAMIQHMHDRLASKKIQLLVVPFPFREQVDENIKFSDPAHSRFIGMREELIALMRDNGIQHVDLSDALRAGLKRGEQIYYKGKNDHPANAGLKIAAVEIAGMLVDGGHSTTVPSTARQARRVAFSKRPDLAAEQILSANGQPLQMDQPAPILIVGDSYTRYPNQTPFGAIPSANLAAQVARHIIDIPRNYSVSSGGACMPILLARKPGILEGVKVCVFVFSPYYPWISGPKKWECVNF